MAKMGKIMRENYGSKPASSSDLPRGKKYRILHLEAMAREEKKFNQKFGTNDMRYQNLYKKALRKPKRKSQSSSIFGGFSY